MMLAMDITTRLLEAGLFVGFWAGLLWLLVGRRRSVERSPYPHGTQPDGDEFSGARLGYDIREDSGDSYGISHEVNTFDADDVEDVSGQTGH